MAGKLVVSTLNNDTGVLATQNGMTGIAKAWVNFNGTGTVAIRDSFNVSSITDNGTGTYTVNFTTAMPNANYSSVVSSSAESTADWNMAYATDIPSVRTASALPFRVSKAQTTTPTDVPYISVAVFSS